VGALGTAQANPGCWLTSENPISGKTTHEGPIARFVGPKIRKVTATQQKKPHTWTKESTTAAQQCPINPIEAHQMGFIGALLFVHLNVQCKR